MALTKTDTTESQFRVSVAVAGVRRFVLTLLSALLVACGGDSDSGADTAAPQAAPLQEQILVFTQAGPLNLVVGDTLSNVASGGLGTGVISYSSSDTTVATVDASGRLTVVGAGIAMITAEKAADTQYAAASADYDVSATPLPQDPGPEPQSIGFDQPGPFSLVVGGTLSNVASGGSGTGVIRYSSSDTTIATVDATTGQLTVVGAGIAMITAEKAADANYTAASASYLVQTTQASQAIGFDQAGPLYLMVGDTLRNVASGGSGTGVISYSSSNTTVATVDAAGELTVVGIGTAEITAEKAADAQYTAASASYTVNAPSRVSVTAWVGRENAEVQVDLPLSTSGMQFFRSNEADCDLSNVMNCANGQSNIVHGGETVRDTAFTLNQTAYYVLQYGANQASLEVSAEERSGLRTNNANNADFSPREAHQVVVHDNKLFLIGGKVSTTDYYNDVWWSEDGVTWTEVPNNGGRFEPRSDHQAVSFKDKLWVIGGGELNIANPRNPISTNDIWYSEDDGRTWSVVDRTERRFPGRSGHQVVVHKDELFLIGGWDSTDRVHKNDVWKSADGVRWDPLTGVEGIKDKDSNEKRTVQKGLQVVSFKDKLWVIGTVDDSTVWSSSDGATWEKRARVGANIRNDTFSTVQLGDTETPVTHEGLHRRHTSRAVVHNGKLWVIGGKEDFSYENDVWRSEDGEKWDLVVDALHEVHPPYRLVTPGFYPRHLHGFVSYNNRLWVIGGVFTFAEENKPQNIPPHFSVFRNDVWRSEDGENWQLGFRDVFEFQ